ncbi:HlyD family secretion protein [Leptolyngbya sp. GGD]|uniref:HlyD family secretion protein n=1 Tax=Leptolyngbya sp. GGD TaxID=2997907 RepID=UPI00227C5E4B|nr:HlyD family efflux transporter periplasmic adaptor subunit [Leptolyngbya sp. GGD]MCY6494435.1 HlyD family efflux transporter periplasmic adaptor subunit [Leptolyngbya sp. GGD]
MNSLSSDSIQSIRTDDFLPSISRWTSLGGIFLVSTIGIAIALSAVTKYNVSVKASSTVRPSGELRVVQAEMEGTVKQIMVKENQSVKRGDVIAYLEDSKLQTQSSQLRSNIQQSQVQLSQLDAQIRSVQRQLLAESNSTDRSIASAEAEIRRAQNDYQEKLLSSQAEVQDAKVTLDLAKDEWVRYQQLYTSGAVSERQAKEKETAVQTAQAKLERATAAANPTQATIAISQENVAQQKAKGESTIATLNRDQEALVQRQAELKAQLIRDQKEQQQIERDLKKTVIRATSDGTVFQLSLLNANQVVRPGDSIAQIAPANTALVAKARVANQDIDKVEIGQLAQLRVEACPYSEFGVLPGKVSAIAPDASSSQSGSGTANATQATGAGGNDRTFAVTISLDQTMLTNQQRQCRIQTGMEATANIVSKEETFLQFVLRKARLWTDL